MSYIERLKSCKFPIGLGRFHFLNFWFGSVNTVKPQIWFDVTENVSIRLTTKLPLPQLYHDARGVPCCSSVVLPQCHWCDSLMFCLLNQIKPWAKLTESC